MIMATLVLKGHSTRGKEVINLLETLGANRLGYKDTFVGFYYYIECGAICSSDEYPTDSTIFTLEEFEETYPYKVGDKVKAWVNGYCGVFNIQDITWDSIAKEVKYRIHDYWHSVENLQPYKEVIMEKNQPPKTQAEVDKYLQEHPIKNVMNVMDIESCLETDGLKLSENVVINSKGIGSIQFIQWYENSQYPKTYDECCKVLMGKTDFQDFGLVLAKYSTTQYEENSISPDPPHISLINNFYKLLICRDAYWKIAGEQMGLGKPWRPDWNNENEFKYSLYYFRNRIIYDHSFINPIILVFPTEEMRDAFCENFKNLIESCKELL
jgi:hypothetical protein